MESSVGQPELADWLKENQVKTKKSKFRDEPIRIEWLCGHITG
jgi:hypothetical protein